MKSAKKSLFSFQVYLPGMDSTKSWDSVTPVVHEFDTDAIAVEAAYALSKQLGKVTVRMVRLKGWDGTNSMIGRMSGAYIQANAFSNIKL